MKYEGGSVVLSIGPALVHDLGKGLTPPEALPRHVGHEERSARLLKGVCERLRVPAAHRELALLVAQFHTHVHRALELRDSTMLELLERWESLEQRARETAR